MPFSSSAAFLWKTGASAGSKRYHMLFTNPPLRPRTSMHTLRWNGSLCSVTVLHIMTIKCTVFKTHVHMNSFMFTVIYQTVWLSFEMSLLWPKQTVCYFGVMRLTFNQLTTLNSRALYFRAANWFFSSFPVKQKLNIYRTCERPEPKSRDQISAQYSKVTEATSTVLTADRLTDQPHCIKSSHILYVVLCALFYFTRAFSSLYPNCVSSPLPGPRMPVWKVKLCNSSLECSAI